MESRPPLSARRAFLANHWVLIAILLICVAIEVATDRYRCTLVSKLDWTMPFCNGEYFKQDLYIKNMDDLVFLGSTDGKFDAVISANTLATNPAPSDLHIDSLEVKGKGLFSVYPMNSVVGTPFKAVIRQLKNEDMSSINIHNKHIVEFQQVVDVAAADVEPATVTMKEGSKQTVLMTQSNSYIRFDLLMKGISNVNVGANLTLPENVVLDNNILHVKCNFRCGILR